MCIRDRVKGDVYNPEELDKKLNGIPGGDVSSLYMDDGYLYFSATPVETSILKDSIDIEIRIREGKQATINRIILNGNTKTSDRVVPVSYTHLDVYQRQAETHCRYHGRQRPMGSKAGRRARFWPPKCH